MITRITLTNFMSHRQTVIEPAAGLTVLVGPNNVGKSAVVAALQILCHNENSTYVMRHGAKNCSVEVETDEGHRIVWRRKTSPSYEIDGQPFDRLRGKDLPRELHDALKMPKVDGSGNDDFDIHFGFQKSPIFLLNSSSANAARFFASSSDASRLVEMQNAHRKKHADAKKEKALLEEESRRLEAQLEVLEPVVEIDDRLAWAERTYAELIDREKWLAEADRHLQLLRDQTFVAARAEAHFGALRPLALPPELHETEPLEFVIAALETEEGQRKLSQSRVDVLAELPHPPELEDAPSLEELLRDLASADVRCRRRESQVGALTPLPAPPELDDVAALDRAICDLNSSTSDFAIATERDRVLQQTNTPPELPDPAPLAELVRSLTGAGRILDRWSRAGQALAELNPMPNPAQSEEVVGLIDRIDAGQRVIRDCEQTLHQVESELKTLVKEIRRCTSNAVCPVCGGSLDAEQVLAQAAGQAGGHTHG